jgi:alpha-beta hydrolase superfamily lysophospholipase
MNGMVETIQMNDGHQIIATVYQPLDTPRGHIHLMHGMAEHQLRYAEIANRLKDAGYLVSTHDHRGHGQTAKQNEAPFGYFAEQDGFERVVKDAHEVIEHIQRHYGQFNITLFGHSMGSFIARRYSQLYSDSLHGAIYCGTGATTALHAAGNVLAKLLTRVQGGHMQSELMNQLSFGSFNKNIANAITDFDWLCSEPKAVKAYMEDPMCGFVSTNQFFVDLTSGLLTLKKATEIQKIRKHLPILMIAGAEDPVGENGKGIYKVASALQKNGLENVVVYLFEGMRHEILNEKNKKHVYDVVIRWLEKNE